MDVSPKIPPSRYSEVNEVDNALLLLDSDINGTPPEKLSRAAAHPQPAVSDRPHHPHHPPHSSLDVMSSESRYSVHSSLSPNFSHQGQRPRIFFYNKEDPYYSFTNFSPHEVHYKGKPYPTSEHLFQSLKFQGHRDELAEHIRTYSPYPSIALSEARRFPAHVRQDWKAVSISMMEETLYHKFTQHHGLRAELLSTANAELVENSDKDSFWGAGADGTGLNELGKALERIGHSIVNNIREHLVINTVLRRVLVGQQVFVINVIRGPSLGTPTTVATSAGLLHREGEVA
ncbi:hypothetical protein NP233_g10026 [Leucocoprinus birnbaumii]|uniref:NADAR domain-containing protein n=1 Tax=Leucocoprinus birnbaumii TaxID=56174 RepID=A0AAD5VJS4_9AGAR|nr:hypothetical protein NP233_g10026 [Leucocoprinus birnbaumii]